jgi:hypothetical protein
MRKATRIMSQGLGDNPIDAYGDEDDDELV